MNHVILSGYIAKDIDYRNFTKADGTQGSSASFSVACSRGKDEVDFINASCFGKTADMVSKYFSKGKGIELEGNIRVSSYTNKDGQKVWQTAVLIERVEFPKATKVESNGTNNAPQNAPQFAQQTGGYVTPTQTPAQPTPQTPVYVNAPAQPTPHIVPTPTPTPAPVPTQNPYSPYGGGWQTDYASAPFN